MRGYLCSFDASVRVHASSCQQRLRSSDDGGSGVSGLLIHGSRARVQPSSFPDEIRLPVTDSIEQERKSGGSSACMAKKAKESAKSKVSSVYSFKYSLIREDG